MATTAADALWCVVPAAGRGLRFGASVPKQYVALGGVPMLLRTLTRMAACDCVAGIVVVLAADDGHWQARPDIGGKPVLTAIGAAERSGSVLAGLRALPAAVDDDAFVLVHDAARPFVACADVERLVRRGRDGVGALLAAPLRDTLKLGDVDGRVVATEPRDRRWRALTPQMFRRGALTEALVAAERDGVAITDEAMAIERSGQRPLLVEGAESNIKVTTSADLMFAQFLLQRTAAQT